MTLARKAKVTLVAIANQDQWRFPASPDLAARRWIPAPAPRGEGFVLTEPFKTGVVRGLRWLPHTASPQQLRMVLAEGRLPGTPVNLPKPALNSPIRYQEAHVLTLGKYAGTTYVVTRGSFYALEPGVTPADLEAWWSQKDAKREQTLVRVRAASTGAEVATSGLRRAIPKDARLLVWQRDGGACVECGSNQNLEFDHIIPVSMGGANTARNLQLLCETCNRAKGGNLV